MSVFKMRPDEVSSIGQDLSEIGYERSFCRAIVMVWTTVFPGAIVFSLFCGGLEVICAGIRIFSWSIVYGMPFVAFLTYLGFRHRNVAVNSLVFALIDSIPGCVLWFTFNSGQPGTRLFPPGYIPNPISFGAVSGILCSLIGNPFYVYGRAVFLKHGSQFFHKRKAYDRRLDMQKGQNYSAFFLSVAILSSLYGILNDIPAFRVVQALKLGSSLLAAYGNLKGRLWGIYATLLFGFFSISFLDTLNISFQSGVLSTIAVESSIYRTTVEVILAFVSLFCLWI